MPDVRRCAINGCESNSRDNKDLKFFNFPDDKYMRNAWLAACIKSAKNIKSKSKPLICSNHFRQSQIGARRLVQGSVPSINLRPKPVSDGEAPIFQKEEDETDEKSLIELHYHCVLEWIKRAQHHPNVLTKGTASKLQLLEISTELRNLLGPKLVLNINDDWIQSFESSYLDLIMYAKNDEKKSLDLIDIIHSVDPEAVIYKNGEIAFSSDIEDEDSQNDFLNEENVKFFEQCSNEVNISHEEQRVVNSSEEQNRSTETDIIDLSEEDSDKNPRASGSGLLSEPILRTYQQALVHLKPLEDFVLRQENFRAIGLLSTLESILKSEN